MVFYTVLISFFEQWRTSPNMHEADFLSASLKVENILYRNSTDGQLLLSGNRTSAQECKSDVASHNQGNFRRISGF